MSIVNKFRSAWRGDVSFFTLVREVLRRRRAAVRQASERRDVHRIAAEAARLKAEFASLSVENLLVHFRERQPALFVLEEIGERAKCHFPDATNALIDDANRIVKESKWELGGFGSLEFKGDNVWRRDPLGTKDWGVGYHADVENPSKDGSDIRILWELNRFGHAVTLACAYAVTSDEVYAETFFSQIEAWMEQNPYGRGANWSCAMETALRAINVLAAFEICRRSDACTEDRLAKILQFCDQHGRFTLDNNEFSYLATSNHYLSDVVGLFWIGTMLPELEHAAEWREFGLSEILGEMDKQILPDGADFEASTGYHNFVTQMQLYSFLLAKKSGIEISGHHWQKLRSMFDYVHGIIRPDGRTPLIGDADGSQIVPVVKRTSDDVAYLLALAAVVFDEPRFKEFAELTPEMLWVFGEEAIHKFKSMQIPSAAIGSAAFPHAGAYVLRDGDLYLHLNANDTGINGRGSHAHNDALSIEVSAFGRPFIVDPGSYVYNLDREARHRFRSTAYHSTVMIDGEEQNTTFPDLPFILGNQAKPKLLEWTATDERDVVSAEHYGYRRLTDPVTHRRTIRFEKGPRYWLIDDLVEGKTAHDLEFRFHSAPDIAVNLKTSGMAMLHDKISGARLLIAALDNASTPELDPGFFSSDYGGRRSTVIIRWSAKVVLPASRRWAIVPLGLGEDETLASERVPELRTSAP